jgi:hypothetical protein
MVAAQRMSESKGVGVCVFGKHDLGSAELASGDVRLVADTCCVKHGVGVR